MKVSIIIPIYNVEPYIKDCLHSVINQTYQNIEIILIDDCGTDNSMIIATEFINQYIDKFKIIIVHHSKNSGLSAARNTGILNATGEYIYFLDSDDTLPNNAIEKLISIALINNGLDFVIGGVKTYGDKVYTYPLHSKPYINNNKEIMKDYFLFKWNVMACNKLIKKEFLVRNNIKFLEGFYHEDMDFSFKLAIHANQMACCYDITYNYLIRKNSITTYKKEKNYNDYFSIITSNINLFKKKSGNQLGTYISNYLIENLYILCIDLIKEKNPQITYKWKKNKLREINKVITSDFKTITPSKSYKIKQALLSLPIPILVLAIKIYINLKNIH